MSKPAGFMELDSFPEQHDLFPTSDLSQGVNINNDRQPNLPQIEAFMAAHDPMDDTVAIVVLSSDDEPDREIASDVLDQLSILLSHEITGTLCEVTSLAQSFSHASFTKQSHPLKARISEL